MRFSLNLSLKDLRRIFPAADFGISCINNTPPLKRLCGATLSEIIKTRFYFLLQFRRRKVYKLETM